MICFVEFRRLFFLFLFVRPEIKGRKEMKRKKGIFGAKLKIHLNKGGSQKLRCSIKEEIFQQENKSLSLIQWHQQAHSIC